MKKQIQMAKTQGLNWQALLIEETQTQIKLAIRNFVLNGNSFILLDREVQKIINETIKDLENEILKIEAKRTLNLFAEKVYKKFISDLGFNYSILLSTIKVMSKGNYSKEEINILNGKIQDVKGLQAEVGLAGQEYHKPYIERVKTALNNMRQIEATIPNGVSLRNLAEMQVRDEKHKNEINTLKENKNILVVCSTHGNCSKRCEPWQGRYYTLDGSTRKIDGHDFIPLETATDVFVTTKSGKTYKNGLLGYNCRHKITVYKPNEIIPNMSAMEIEKEREIDQRMRQLERNVRMWKEEKVLNSGVDKKRYEIASKKAIEWNKRYIDYAKTSGRAYYPDRVKII